jgi:hypothetical protein
MVRSVFLAHKEPVRSVNAVSLNPILKISLFIPDEVVALIVMEVGL